MYLQTIRSSGPTGYRRTILINSEILTFPAYYTSSFAINSTLNSDITVIKASKSDRYVLKPQIAESGPNQKYTAVIPEWKTEIYQEKHQEKHEVKHRKPDGA